MSRMTTFRAWPMEMHMSGFVGKSVARMSQVPPSTMMFP